MQYWNHPNATKCFADFYCYRFYDLFSLLFLLIVVVSQCPIIAGLLGPQSNYDTWLAKTRVNHHGHCIHLRKTGFLLINLGLIEVWVFQCLPPLSITLKLMTFQSIIHTLVLYCTFWVLLLIVYWRFLLQPQSHLFQIEYWRYLVTYIYPIKYVEIFGDI